MQRATATIEKTDSSTIACHRSIVGEGNGSLESNKVMRKNIIPVKQHYKEMIDKRSKLKEKVIE